MLCDETQILLHPYIDGELNLMESLRVEEHLKTCAACAQSRRNYEKLRVGLQDTALYAPVPDNLHVRLPSLSPDAAVSRRSVFRLTPRYGWGLAAALAIAAVLSWSVFHVQPTSSTDRLLAQEVVASHVRSLMGAHLADVASSNQHTVKPWFNGKLDYSPPVKDLAPQGFPLIGGRLDYLDNRPVAALIYRHGKHFINLFVWPLDTTKEQAGDHTATVMTQGYQVVHWDEAGMTYWAVSDTNIDELNRFTRLIQEDGLTTPSPPGQH